MVNQKRKEMNEMKISIGAFSIVLDEATLERLTMFKECDYMSGEMMKIIGMVIELWQENFRDNELMPADKGMSFISILNEVSKDYQFLTALRVGKNSDPVFAEENNA